MRPAAIEKSLNCSLEYSRQPMMAMVTFAFDKSNNSIDFAKIEIHINGRIRQKIFGVSMNFLRNEGIPVDSSAGNITTWPNVQHQRAD